MGRGDSGSMEGSCFSFSCGCLTGGCLSALLVLSLAIGIFAYGYMVGMVSHPNEYAYVRVSGPEMNPAIRKGDIVMVDRDYYDHDSHQVERGDIVWLEPSEGSDREGRFLLRVAALPGESINFDASGELRIEGKKLGDFPVLTGVAPQRWKSPPDAHQLSPNELFLVPDNPDYTSETRPGGTMPIKNLRGKAVSILFPPTRMGALEEDRT